MRVILLCLILFVSQHLSAQISGPQSIGATVLQQPPNYLGYLDLNGTLPLPFATSPNDAALEAKYWFHKSPRLQNSFGLSWQIGFNEGYGKSASDFTIDGQSGKELAYLYNYLSLRYKVMKGFQKIRPYAEIGGGWLFLAHQFVERPRNPDYDPDHTCPDGPNEYLRNTTLIRSQHRLALDVEAGLHYQLTDIVSLNVGVGGIITNQVAHLEEPHPSAFLEEAYPSVFLDVENPRISPIAYQFKNDFLHSVSLKVGVSILLATSPNEGDACCCPDNSDSYFTIDVDESRSCSN